MATTTTKARTVTRARATSATTPATMKMGTIAVSSTERCRRCSMTRIADGYAWCIGQTDYQRAMGWPGQLHRFDPDPDWPPRPIPAAEAPTHATTPDLSGKDESHPCPSY